MNSLVLILSIVAIGIFTIVLNRKVKNKSRMSLVLAVIFLLYISTFFIIGLIKG